MDELPYARIKSLFLRSMELPASEREAFVHDACGDDAGMIAAVLDLFARAAQETTTAADAGPGDLGIRPMDRPLLPPGERPGDFIGPYKLLEVIGEGGFGTVYLAERREPIVQRVALKIIKQGMDTKAVVARFEQERQALAVMDHPFIAKVFDAGATPAGRPYFVMEHVPGEPITDYADRHKMSVRQRLELFAGVCEAVQHAHLKGIIHRDIKPSNILVAVRDGKPLPKVIDFGVAKAITHTLTEKTIFTESGQLIGTPEYMSPEQAEMGVTDIDTRTDVYSLGVVLYELLSGLLPFDSRALRSAGFWGICKVLREQDPPKPSTRLSTADAASGDDIARHRRAAREHLASELRRELDWIPLKALRKDRTERYQSPADLARDVRNYLEGKPLEAGPESTAYRARKFLNKQAKVVAVLWVIFAAVLLTQMRQAVQLGAQKEASAVAAESWSWGSIAIERWLGSTQAKYASLGPETARRDFLSLSVPLLREIGRLSNQLAEQNVALDWIVSDYYEDAARLAKASNEELQALAVSDALDASSKQFPIRMHDYGREPSSLVRWSPTPADRLDAIELRQRLDRLIRNYQRLLMPAQHFQHHDLATRQEIRFSDWSASRELWETTLGDPELARSVLWPADSRTPHSIEVADLIKLVQGHAVIESSAFPPRLDVYASRRWKLPLACALITVVSVACWLWPHPNLLRLLSASLPVVASAMMYLTWYNWRYGMLSGAVGLMHLNAALLLLPGVLTLAVHERWKSVVVVVCATIAVLLLASTGQYIPGSRHYFVSLYRLL